MASPHTTPLLGAAGAVITAGGAFMTVKGFEQSKTRASILANVWFDLGLALVILGLVAVLVALYLHFRKKTPSATPRAVPGSLTLGTVHIADDSRLHIDSTAERFADGTKITDRATVTGRHFPGDADRLNSA